MQASLGSARVARPCMNMLPRGASVASTSRPLAPGGSCRPSVVVASRGGRGAGRGGGGAGRGSDNLWDKLTGDEGPFKGFKNPFGGQGDATPSRGGSSGGGASGGAGGRGGGDDSGGLFGGGSTGDGDDGPEKSVWQEFTALMYGIWVVFWNTAMFLAFADMLHRSLDWCCQIELLLLVGAPQQAWERVAAQLYAMVEGFEKNVLGWDIPGDDDMIPMHENIALYYPEEHAYTFDSYRYNMTNAEKQKLKYHYALRHGGQAGEVDAQDVQAIEDKYEPMEADRRAYQASKASGTLDAYWDSKKDVYKSMVRGGARA